MLQFTTIDHCGTQDRRKRRGSKGSVLQNAVKRLSLYPSSGKFGRDDGLHYTVLTVEGALNRVGNDACLIKVMV
jgi:hypothetical protein